MHIHLSNCIICNNPFLKKARDICQNCLQVETDMLLRVKEYLRKSPKARITEVEEETGVSIKFINRFIREGRLELTLKCQKCGSKMKSSMGNTMCPRCKDLIRKDIMSSSERLDMEKKVTEEKVKELQQQQVNNSLRKTLYGLKSKHD